jgi:hypothetical protein
MKSFTLLLGLSLTLTMTADALFDIDLQHQAAFQQQQANKK